MSKSYCLEFHLEEYKKDWEENEVGDAGAESPSRRDVSVVHHAELVLQPGRKAQHTCKVVPGHLKKRYHSGSWPKLRKKMARARKVARRRGLPDDGRRLFRQILTCVSSRKIMS